MLLAFVTHWENSECCNVFSSTNYQHFQAVLKYHQLPVSSQYAYCVTSKRQVLGGRFKSDVCWLALTSSILSSSEYNFVTLNLCLLISTLRRFIAENMLHFIWHFLWKHICHSRLCRIWMFLRKRFMKRRYGRKRQEVNRLRNFKQLQIKYRVIQNDCRGFNNFSHTIHLVLQMQPHVISFYGVTSRIRFMFLLFPQLSRNWRLLHATNSLERTRLSCWCL